LIVVVNAAVILALQIWGSYELIRLPLAGARALRLRRCGSPGEAKPW
jgi:hypothetical protein